MGRGWRGESRGDFRGSRDERGFWDRASDEVASWFGDDEAERRRLHDHRRDEHMGGRRERGEDRDYGRDRSFLGGGRPDRDFDYDRGLPSRTGSSERDWERNRSDFSRDRDYRPMTGDYGRREREFGDQDRWHSPSGREEFRRTGLSGSRGDQREFDPHYRSWRDRHLSDLDRDYDDYRRENQSRFENDFTSWREKRQQKRGLLGQIREHMEVVGNDDQHVGTIDKVAGDRIILTKSDPESGGAHHSLSCSDIDRVEGDRIILDCSSDQAKSRWLDESRSRALFEREDQGEMGPGILDRSFPGTYR